MRGRRSWGFAWLLALAAAACGLEPLPPRYAVPLPFGDVLDVPFQCATLPAPTQVASPFAFDEQWARTETFERAKPKTELFVVAKDVRAHFSEAQRREFPNQARAAGKKLVPIGGNYWADSKVRIANDAWVSSGFSDDTQKGTMWRAFTMDGDSLRVAVGGDDDPEVGVELLVDRKDATDLHCAIQSSSRAPIAGHETYVPVAVVRGGSSEVTDARELEAKCALRGRSAIVRIFDFSQKAHVNVGRIDYGDPASRAAFPDHVPVWGLADTHTHPTSFTGFGGLQGIHTLWGVPGGSISDYRDPSSERAKINVSRDIPQCDHVAKQKNYSTHHGGFAAATMINVAEGRASEDLEDLKDARIADIHRSQGGPSFADFPDFRHGAHQLHHITQIHRAYMGGLRLMTALALQNQGLEYGMGWVKCGGDGRPTVETTPDLAIVHAHVQVMRELARLNKDWMEIAYTPEQARRIIGQNKLAVVLGVEVPQLGEPGRSVVDEVEELHRLGIRQVIPIHSVDNALGGPAVFQDLYNSVGDWLNRCPQLRDWVQQLSGAVTESLDGYLAVAHDNVPAAFYDVTTAQLEDQERILYRLGNPRRIVLSDVFPHPGPLTHVFHLTGLPQGLLHPFVNATPLGYDPNGFYDHVGKGGMRNARGLTPRGKEFLARLMERGMLLDAAHMSDASLQDTYAKSDSVSAKQHCGEYPVMVSHAHFRQLSVTGDYTNQALGLIANTKDRVRPIVVDATKVKTYTPNPMSECIQHHEKCEEHVLRQAQLASQQAYAGPGTASNGNLPREYDITSSEVREVSRRKSVIGVFLAQGMLDTTAIKDRMTFANDCAGSSKGFAAALLYAEQMGLGGIALASDLAFTRGVVPRFGRDACSVYLDAGGGSSAGAQLLDTLVNPSQFNFAQKDGVAYGPTGDALDPYVMGTRTYDFNHDGLAHYGLIPDMLQDVANVMGGTQSLEPVFDSAEAYIQMWERARKLAHCEGGLCKDDERTSPDEPWACGDACPHAWNGGAPLESVAELYATCAPGNSIHMVDTSAPVTRDACDCDEGDSPRVREGTVQPKHAQHGAHTVDDPRLPPAADLKLQGDWAVIPIGNGQLWSCGDGKLQALGCPPEANYVKVRRILESTMGDLENCSWEPVPPAAGNRRVVFECLVGPTKDRKWDTK